MGIRCSLDDDRATLFRGPCNACGNVCETSHVHAYGAAWVGICNECIGSIDSFRLGRRAAAPWKKKKARGVHWNGWACSI
jgi:hypothetical protein